VAASLEEATMSSNLENDGLVGLQIDGLVGLQNNGLVGLQNDGLVSAMTAPGPRRAKNPRDDLVMPPLLPRRKSSRIARTVSEEDTVSKIMREEAEYSPSGDDEEEDDEDKLESYNYDEDPDAALNFLAANSLFDDNPLPKNENDLNLESPKNIITCHKRTDDSCTGSCNHDNTTYASFDSDHLDDEDDHVRSDYLDDKDDSMEPAPMPASKPASDAMIVELKEQCINTINDKLTTFPASLRDYFIEKAKPAKIGKLFYWCQGLCDY
jgi:hypothetical protein